MQLRQTVNSQPGLLVGVLVAIFFSGSQSNISSPLSFFILSTPEQIGVNSTNTFSEYFVAEEVGSQFK